MWIRDELPRLLPGVRFLIYGYLLGSESFQTISHLENSLIDVLKLVGYSEPSSRLIFFLAHSLGGVVLKQSLVTLAGGYERERAILNKIQGAMFFGVPSRGMSIPDLFTVMDCQPNRALLDDLSDQSKFLPLLDQQFKGISDLQKLCYYWAYETKTTHRIEVRVFSQRFESYSHIIKMSSTTGRFARTGTASILVSLESATMDLCKTEPLLTLQIDENHSDMVKFSAGDHLIRIVAEKLDHLSAQQPQTFNNSRGAGARSVKVQTMPTTYQAAPSALEMDPSSSLQSQGGRSKLDDLQSWNQKSIKRSLRAPERDYRLQQIDERVGNTFDWAFDDDSTGLRQWLSKGSGLF